MIEIKSEASYSRIYQHTQDDSTFAIIGSEDKDTKESRLRELYDLIRKATRKYHNIGFNKVYGAYVYDDGTRASEDSVIIYNIPKDEALRIANKINQETIVWKDADFFGLIYANGEEDIRFKNEPGKNMDFSHSDEKGYGSKLPNDSHTNLGFTFEGTIRYPDKHSTDFTVESFRFVEDRVDDGLHEYKICFNTGTYQSYPVVVRSTDVQTAIDDAVDILDDENSPCAMDYYDLYDMTEVGETVDEYAESNGLICAGNRGLYVGIDNIYEDGKSIWYR